jgi:hypothetical protein
LADDENRTGLVNENDLGKKSALLDTRNVQLLVVARQRDFMCEFRSGYLGGQTHKLRKGAECGKNNPWKKEVVDDSTQHLICNCDDRDSFPRKIY